jgi:cell fate (sporulation/competence/biofilm development) regulator YlbF (YheA/YmcA/DUF963 family)
MDEIIGMAAKLGQKIRVHPRYEALRRAEERVVNDADARKLQEDLQKQLEHIHQLETEGKPIEVVDKHELARLQEAARSHPGLQELLKAQADYFEMMNHVNNAILAELAVDQGAGGETSEGTRSA